MSNSNVTTIRPGGSGHSSKDVVYEHLSEIESATIGIDVAIDALEVIEDGLGTLNATADAESIYPMPYLIRGKLRDEVDEIKRLRIELMKLSRKEAGIVDED